MPAGYLLGIETSCDETSAAVVKEGKVLLSNVISSQIMIHRRYGGVVPEVASRQHLEKIDQVVTEALASAGIDFGDLEGVAVTVGPGLIGALLVGVAAAKAYAYALKLPLIPVHHTEAHLYANFLTHPSLRPPLVSLIVSGGHTSLIYLKDHLDYRLLGSTRDDAAGEAFDKVARVLGLPYPGGPALEMLAREGDPQAIRFPRAWLGEDNLEFSFSGLKTAVINYLHQAEKEGRELSLPDVAASFQEAIVEVLVEKTMTAARLSHAERVALAGGVAANGVLRQRFQRCSRKNGYQFYCPALDLCTDNAAMVACAGYYRYREGVSAPLSLEANAHLPLPTC